MHRALVPSPGVAVRRGARALAALLLALASQSAAADLTHFYCYAPDPASGTVYVSTALPVGPVAERRGYGAEFVEHLRKTGRVRADVTAYCVMREGAGLLARSRAALPLEPCEGCGGLTRFAEVAWSRGGVTLPAAPLSPPIRSELHEPRPPAAEPPNAPAPSPAAAPAADFGPVVVVLGNTETGKLLVVSGQPDLENAARAQAQTLRATGWTELVATREPGYGAAMCVRDGDATRFFAVHGRETPREAIRAARERAEAYAAPRHAEIRPCGAPWIGRAGPVEPDEPRDTGPLDYVKGKVREWVTCDPQRTEPGKKCPPPPKSDAVGTRG